MPRIVGVDIPKEKRIDIGLRYIFGVGPYLANLVLKKADVPPHIRGKDLTEEEVAKITRAVQESSISEGNLRRELGLNIKRLMDIGCYRGFRHKRGLPVRGQRTRTNARTRKGPRKTIGAQIRKTAPAAPAAAA